MQWLDLKYLKLSYALDLAEYGVVNNINEEPSFNWWIKNALHARYRLFSSMERRSAYASDTDQGGSKNK